MPVWDRDAENLAADERLTDAAIAHAGAGKGQHPPSPSGYGGQGRPEPEPPSGPENSAELWDELRAWGRQPARGNERDASAARMASDVLGAGERTASRGMSAFAAAVEKVLSGVFSFFGFGEPRLTPQQAHDRARAEGKEETLHARAFAAHEQAKEAEADERIFNQDHQQQQEDFSARYGTPGGSFPGRERDDDYDRGRERER